MGFAKSIIYIFFEIYFYVSNIFRLKSKLDTEKLCSKDVIKVLKYIKKTYPKFGIFKKNVYI
ncbi:hypothetical protein IW15_22045 [Chryseobacterium soli]|uniref:Uncharacterized protein n=1 Tax=Chryseobacterium soli TaxID=445961 RepID=A0A085ZZI7_9FLAO|nr:hypothetical protein IW15_22045 [Chryseobacterium soli]